MIRGLSFFVGTPSPLEEYFGRKISGFNGLRPGSGCKIFIPFTLDAKYFVSIS
jgi:hypothetical protein